MPQIPYCYASDVAAGTRSAMEQGFVQMRAAVPGITYRNVGLAADTGGANWNRQTTRCNEAPAVYISSTPQGCFSYVGMISSWQTQQLNLQSPGCDSIGTGACAVFRHLFLFLAFFA